MSFQILVFFPSEQRAGVKTLRIYLEKMKQENVNKCVLVLQQPLTSFACNVVNDFSVKYHIEIFQVALAYQSMITICVSVHMHLMQYCPAGRGASCKHQKS
jgi:hypothetical protein